ncbi:MAG: type I DNA topoisomerase [Alphaproteobacteria bacterium]|nr:type I DNA topoisomerase [Alphaproteobacteria bacterium]
MSKKLVIVESPAKSKTIEKYLGKDFKVLASFGHIRDLPSKDGSVDTENQYKMKWASDTKSKKTISDIANAMKEADELYLATDLDREGEAISWHVYKVLEAKKLLKGKTVKRIVFNEITKTAILDSFKHAREIDKKMVEAYLTRRALDYLVGFNISPVLWRKLPGAKSAGRVQSVALRLVCDREQEIEDFKPAEYWDVLAKFTTENKDLVEAKLYSFEGKKLNKLDINNEAQAKNILDKLNNAKEYKVISMEDKVVSRNPAAPFITSSLQIDASRKLGFGATKTMQTAQKLYEGVDIGKEGTVGLITYMRTDSINLSNEAISGARKLIEKEYGSNYLPAKPRVYSKKAKGAQEAHEAIRPTNFLRKPQDLKPYLDEDQFKLYELIWKRTVACQMASAKFNQATLNIAADNHGIFRATGFITIFDGFRKLYAIENDEEKSLPKLNEGENLNKDKIEINQHFTKPPARFSEASLVKKLEDLGIGRPSTYASIMRVLKTRNYVRVEQRRFIPEQKGRLVNSFLTNYFKDYVEYEFTSDMEKQLDSISMGEKDWIKTLDEFWTGFKKATEAGMELDHQDIKEKITQDLSHLLFADDNRECPKCKEGKLELNFGKYGEFLGCSRYPDCDYKRSFTHHKGEEDKPDFEDNILGKNEEGIDVWFKEGPYGFYIQLGAANGKGKNKPKRATLPKGIKVEDVNLPLALNLLSLPKSLGEYEGEEVKTGIGRYGNYILYKGAFTTSNKSALEVTLEEAIEMLKEAEKNPKAKGRAKAAPLKELGKYEKNDIAVYSGRYGPYVKCGKVNATIPKDKKPEEVTLEEAIELIKAKKAK